MNLIKKNYQEIQRKWFYNVLWLLLCTEQMCLSDSSEHPELPLGLKNNWIWLWWYNFIYLFCRFASSCIFGS